MLPANPLWPQPPNPSRSAPPEATGAQAGCLTAFFSLFLLIGLGAFIAMVGLPALNILEARDWTATPCDIISSQVKSHSDSDGTTYSVDLSYRYQIKGREYQSNRYHFATGSSSGMEGKQAVVNRYPAGSRTVCYVNPQDPTDAVIERGFVTELLFGLIPLVFILIGAGGIFYARNLNKPKPAQALTAGWQPPEAAVTNAGTGATSGAFLLA